MGSVKRFTTNETSLSAYPLFRYNNKFRYT